MTPEHSVALSVLGTRVLVDGPPAAVRDVQRLWSPFRAAAGGAGSADLQRPAHPLGQLATAINLTALAAVDALALHAAVLARAGVTVVVPARSGAGKSTLAAAMLRAGWGYVSDEALVLDWDTGRLRPYPRPLGLSEWSRTAVCLTTGSAGEPGEYVVSPSELGAAIVLAPPPVAHVVLLDRVAGAREPQLAAVHRHEAVVALLERCFNHYRRPARALQLVADVARSSSVWRLSYADPVSAAGLLSAAW